MLLDTVIQIATLISVIVGFLSLVYFINSFRRELNMEVVIHFSERFEKIMDTFPDEFFYEDAKKAARVIDRDRRANLIDEATLKNGGSYTRTIRLYGDKLPPLKATLVWTDPAGISPASATLDNPKKMLVNDLDIRIVKSGTTYYPWRLDRFIPDSAAIRTVRNNTDNVEQVLIDEPEPGTYKVIVDHSGTLKDHKDQNFSIVLSAAELDPVSVFNIGHPSPRGIPLNMPLVLWNTFFRCPFLEFNGIATGKGRTVY